MPGLDSKNLTLSELKSTLIDGYKDFFEVMFFGKFKYEADKKYIEDQKVILGEELKSQLKSFAANPKGILTAPNDAIDTAIEKDSKKEGTKSNIHTLSDYKNENKSKLYDIIAYTYNKEIVNRLPVEKWRGNIVFTTINQSVRLNSRVSQIEAIMSLYESVKEKSEDILLFDVSQKLGGFQQANYTVKSSINGDLTEKQKEYLKQLDESVTVIKTEMYNRKKGDKDYKDVEEFSSKDGKDVKIHLLDITAQKLRQDIVSEDKSVSSSEILVADAGNAYSQGGDPFGGGSGLEESLIKSDPKLYLKLMTAISDFYQDTTEFEEKKEKYKEKAKKSLALVSIYAKALDNAGSDKLLLAINEEIKKEEKPPKKGKNDEISSFMSGLLTKSSFKLKNSLLKEIESEIKTIKSDDPKVEKLATEMLRRKSKNKIIMIDPKEICEPDSKKSKSGKPDLKSGYVVFNAPDLRAIKEYIASKLCDKLEALVATEKEKLVGKSDEEIEKRVKELIEKETPVIEAKVTEKIYKRVYDSIKYQVATACKAAVGKYKYLILGAIGGGIFKCPNERVAQAFKYVLVDKKYKDAFKGVYFAIYKNPTALEAYRKVFGAAAAKD